MKLTDKRKARFCQETAQLLRSKIGFIDVGSGGELKNPWNLLPKDKIGKFNFEPTGEYLQSLPICISNHNRTANFFVAENERASSLYKVSDTFVKRFGLNSLNIKEVIKVNCVTLDAHFKDHFDQIDLMDINTEGHDLRVLEGANEILEVGFVKLIKVEFLLTEVWKGQGWFSDIDCYLRDKDYDLARIEIDHVSPARVNHIFHRGEPLYGKAHYTPKIGRFRTKLSPSSGDSQRQQTVEDQLLKAVMLYIVTDLLGRAFDVLDMAEDFAKPLILNRQHIQHMKKEMGRIFRYAVVDEVTSTLWKMARLGLRQLRQLRAF